MAKNTGRGTRLGSVSGRSQRVNPRPGLATKRDTTSGGFAEVKGVRKER